MKRLLLFVILAGLWLIPAPAQAQDYDGLTLLGAGHTFTDPDTKMQFFAFKTKYQEPLIGCYMWENGNEIHFYMNPTVWDKFKQILIRARDNWETLQPREFDQVGTINSYKVANRVATLRLSLLGATELESRQVLISLTGGADRPRRCSIALARNNVKDLVEDLDRIDAFFRQAPAAK